MRWQRPRRSRRLGGTWGLFLLPALPPPPALAPSRGRRCSRRSHPPRFAPGLLPGLPLRPRGSPGSGSLPSSPSPALGSSVTQPVLLVWRLTANSRLEPSFQDWDGSVIAEGAPRPACPEPAWPRAAPRPLGSVWCGNLGPWDDRTARGSDTALRSYCQLPPVLPEREVAAPASERLGLGKEVLQNGPGSHRAPLSAGGWGSLSAPRLGGQSFRVPCQGLSPPPERAEGPSRPCFLGTREWSRKRP